MASFDETLEHNDDTSPDYEADDSFFEFMEDDTDIKDDKEKSHMNLIDNITKNKGDKWRGKKLTLLDKFLDMSSSVSSPSNGSSFYSTSANTMTTRSHTNEAPSIKCLLRIKNDILEIYNDTPPGIFIVPDDRDLTKIHALITGPSDTPYEGGFFYFVVHFPHDYPINPPRVKFMTTREGEVRFNPNFYCNGIVCLSILGTWSGPKWTPVHTLSSVLISIQSLMNEHPYCNEPAFEMENSSENSKQYNKVIQHETLRVAVCNMLEGNTTDTYNFPLDLKEVIEESFLKHYEFYMNTVKSKESHSNEKVFEPFSGELFECDYISIRERLERIKTRLENKETVSSYLQI